MIQSPSFKSCLSQLQNLRGLQSQCKSSGIGNNDQRNILLQKILNLESDVSQSISNFIQDVQNFQTKMTKYYQHIIAYEVQEQQTEVNSLIKQEKLYASKRFQDRGVIKQDNLIIKSKNLKLDIGEILNVIESQIDGLSQIQAQLKLSPTFSEKRKVQKYPYDVFDQYELDLDKEVNSKSQYYSDLRKMEEPSIRALFPNFELLNTKINVKKFLNQEYTIQTEYDLDKQFLRLAEGWKLISPLYVLQIALDDQSEFFIASLTSKGGYKIIKHVEFRGEIYSIEFIPGTMLYLLPKYGKYKTSLRLKNLYTHKTLQKVGKFQDIRGFKFIESENLIAVFTRNQIIVYQFTIQERIGAKLYALKTDINGNATKFYYFGDGYVYLEYSDYYSLPLSYQIIYKVTRQGISTTTITNPQEQNRNNTMYASFIDKKNHRLVQLVTEFSNMKMQTVDFKEKLTKIASYETI